jgi:hypothetical protein
MSRNWWGIYILALLLRFLGGIIAVAPEFGSDFFWLVVPLFLALFFPLYY